MKKQNDSRPVITDVLTKEKCLLKLGMSGCESRSGKVREIFDLGDAMLFVASDRISAFDRILPNPIPEKGRVLTEFSKFWFDQTRHIVPNAMISTNIDEIVKRINPGAFTSALVGRTMLMRKGKPLQIEGVVRGYLAGSGWKEYKKSQTVCGIPLPAGLVESSELPEPIFTPSTKAEVGHDENITFGQASEIVGEATALQVRDYALKLYKYARKYALKRGIIIADTKFEFALFGDEILLIDEALTPDSSRFWPAAEYKPGGAQPSFDKQYLRDYLELTIKWDKESPAPELPADVIQVTSEKYLEALQRLTA